MPDPTGDDHGPAGSCIYPTARIWIGQCQMDLRQVRVASAGGALRLDLTTAAITRSWNPANGFDPVAFTVYIELSSASGDGRVMPNPTLPSTMSSGAARALKVTYHSVVIVVPCSWQNLSRVEAAAIAP